MSPINIMKVNVTINFLKIVSVWGASLLLVSKVSIMYADFKTTYTNTLKDITECKSDIKELQKWRSQVTAYYTKPDFNSQKNNQ